MKVNKLLVKQRGKKKAVIKDSESNSDKSNISIPEVDAGADLSEVGSRPPSVNIDDTDSGAGAGAGGTGVGVDSAVGVDSSGVTGEESTNQTTSGKKYCCCYINLF